MEEEEEVIMKKEKLSNGGIKEVIVQAPEQNMLVIKDGKVQLAAVNDNAIMKKKDLEIVQQTKKKVTTSTSFKQVNHTEKWTEKETEKFYRVTKFF